jgi:hypothetical protein
MVEHHRGTEHRFCWQVHSSEHLFNVAKPIVPERGEPKVVWERASPRALKDFARFAGRKGDHEPDKAIEEVH